MGATLSFQNKHVLITGGSSGIGFELARCFAGDGAKVTLLARSTDTLEAACQELKESYPGIRVHAVSADVGAYEPLATALKTLMRELDPVDVLVCSAGMCIPKLMVDQSIAEANQTMQVNYFGCYNAVHILLPSMLARRSGHICLVSSMVYANPMVGYSAYSPTKAAVRHLADCLRSELHGSGVSVSVAYPPDTQTSGYEKENTTKPAATKAISAAFQDHVYNAQRVALLLFRGMKRGRYHLPTPDVLHQLGLSLVAGITPRPQWLLVEVLLAPVLVVVAVVTYMIQDRIVLCWPLRRKSEHED